MSYSAIESLKDGLLFSGKYEGGVKLFPPPHVVIFANFLPDMTKLSIDRWDIHTLLNNPPRRLLPDKLNKKFTPGGCAHTPRFLSLIC